jgi:hypothetical protein
VRGKKNDLSGVYVAQQDGNLAGRGSYGAVAHNSKEKPWKTPFPLLSYFLGPKSDRNG